jgi:hypothetical protein
LRNRRSNKKHTCSNFRLEVIPVNTQSIFNGNIIRNIIITSEKNNTLLKKKIHFRNECFQVVDLIEYNHKDYFITTKMKVVESVRCIKTI